MQLIQEAPPLNEQNNTEENQFRKKFWSILIMLNIALITAGILAGYSKKDYSVNQKENSHLIGASYMTMNNEFYKIMSEEISARIEAEGDKMVLRDPALNADRQAQQITEMLDMGIDVLVVTPVEEKSLTTVLERAKEQGVIIVVVDSNIYDEELADCTIISDNYNAGQLVGEYFLKQNQTANLIIMTHETTKSGKDRVQGFLDVVQKQDGITVVKQIGCEGQLEIAMPKLQEAIDEGVEFDSVFCLNDLAGVGVVAALSDNQMLDAVNVYGVDASPDSKALIKEGMMRASAAQFPSKIGNEAANAIYRLLQGETVQKNILVPVQLITEKNVAAFGTDRWQ